MLLLYRKMACYKHGVLILAQYNFLDVDLSIWISYSLDFFNNMCKVFVSLSLHSLVCTVYYLLIMQLSEWKPCVLISNHTIISFINWNSVTALANQAIMNMVSLGEVLPVKAFRGLVSLKGMLSSLTKPLSL